MKLYEVEIGGVTHLVQLSEEEAALRAEVDAEKAAGEVAHELADNRAPSAKGETEDEMGRPLVESAAAENAERLERKKRALAARKAAAASTKQRTADETK